MDRVELLIKLEQINKLREAGNYEEAVAIADTIEWRKVKKWSELSVAADVYEKTERYSDARNICIYAYNRNLGGKRLVYRLTELAIKLNDFEEADELYAEYAQLAPRDVDKYILQYKLNKARGSSKERLIEILEEYKEKELEEVFQYELASLYAETGRIEDCVRECDDLILWFNEGEYVEKALRLKQKYRELTKPQQTKLKLMEEYRSIGKEYTLDVPQSDEVKNTSIDDIHVPEKEISIYDTQHIQAQVAMGMQEFYEMEKNLADNESATSGWRGVNTHEIVLENDAAEAAPSMEPELEEAPSEEPELEQAPSADDYVDEPTKEIRVNTHKWKVYKSIMQEDGSVKLVEEPTAYVRNAEQPSEPEETVEAEQPSEPEEIVEAEQPSEPEEVREDDVLEGQINLWDWMESLNSKTEAKEEIEEKKEIEEIREKEEIKEADISMAENSVEEDIFSQALENVTAQLIAEIREEAATEETEIHEEAASEDTDSQEKNSTDKTESEESGNVENTDSCSVLSEDDIDNDFVLKQGELKFLKKYLYVNGLESEIAQVINERKKMVLDETSRTGNIAIYGNAKTDRTAFAIDLVKAMNVGSSADSIKIAKVSSMLINKKGIMNMAHKLYGNIVIVEEAGKLTSESVEEMCSFFKEDTGSMLVILTGEDFALKKVFASNYEFAQMFNFSIELRHLSVNELVLIAKEHAKEQGYVVSEKAIAQLYMIINDISHDHMGDEIDRVKAVMDAAIEKNTKKKKKKDAVISLKEKDFI